MPRGRYASPNPTHFHMARFCLAELRSHPLFQRFSKLPFLANTHNQDPRDRIIININTPRVLTIDMSLKTLQEFIEPFNKVLNCINAQSTKESSEEKQSVDSEHHYEYDFVQINDDQSVLKKQRDMVMRDINSNVALLELDKSFSDLEVVEMSESEESDHIADNVIDFAKKMTNYNFENMSSQERINETVRIWNNEKPYIDNTVMPDKSNNQNLYELPEVLPAKIVEEYAPTNNNKYSISDSILKSVLEISQGYDEILAEHEQSNTEIECEKLWTDKSCIRAVKLISRRIYKFIMQVCVETIESLEFPEIRCYHDAEEFFDAVLLIYEKFMEYFPEEKDINTLKKCITNSVLKCLGKYFFIIPVTKDNNIDTKIANRKLIALKKFLTVIIYILFDKIENPDFQCTHYDINYPNNFADDLESQFHSTPESCELYYTLSESSEDKAESEVSYEKNDVVSDISKKMSTTEDSNVANFGDSDTEESFTTFLSQKSDKTGNLRYWFMINDKVSPRQRASSLVSSPIPCMEKVRRLSAPARFMSDLTRPLSPIMEEPRRNLYFELSQCEDGNESTEEDVLNKTVTLATDTKSESVNVSSNLFYDSANSSLSSIKSEKARRKIVFQNEVTFIVKPNVDTNYEGSKSVKSVTFLPENNLDELISSMDLHDLDSNTYVSASSLQETEEENWMGLDAAKF